MLSVKQGRINYHFLSLWYDSTLDWTLVSRTIGEHSTHEFLILVNTNQLKTVDTVGQTLKSQCVNNFHFI